MATKKLKTIRSRYRAKVIPVPQPRMRTCRSVGSLIKALQKLPKKLPLANAFQDTGGLRPVWYNIGDDSECLHLEEE